MFSSLGRGRDEKDECEAVSGCNVELKAAQLPDNVMNPRLPVHPKFSASHTGLLPDNNLSESAGTWQ